jgi:hypothetical protein
MTSPLPLHHFFADAHTSPPRRNKLMVAFLLNQSKTYLSYSRKNRPTSWSADSASTRCVHVKDTYGRASEAFNLKCTDLNLNANTINITPEKDSIKNRKLLPKEGTHLDPNQRR